MLDMCMPFYKIRGNLDNITYLHSFDIALKSISEVYIM